MTDISGCLGPCHLEDCCCCCCCDGVVLSFRCGAPATIYPPGCECCGGACEWTWTEVFGIFIWVPTSETCTSGCSCPTPTLDGTAEGQTAITTCGTGGGGGLRIQSTDTGDCRWVWLGEYWDLDSTTFKCKPGYNCIMPAGPGNFVGEIQYTTCIKTNEISFFNIIPPQEFPEFDNEIITSEDNIFAFSGENCSVPCSGVTVTLGSTCCISCDEVGIVTAEGNGTITGGASPTSITGCGELTVKVNGSSLPYEATDGEVLSVSVEAESCCCCYFVECGADPCAPAAALYYVKKGKLHLNKQSLLTKITAVKQKHARITKYKAARTKEKQKYILQLRDLNRPKKAVKRNIKLL